MSQRRQQYVFRANHQNPLQRQAWQILQKTPAAERRTLVAQAIVNFHNDQAAEARLRKLLREELARVSIKAENTDRPVTAHKPVPQRTIDFLASLQKKNP